MTIIEHDGEKYVKVMEHSAIRPHGKDRVKVRLIDNDGTVKCISQTVNPKYFSIISSVYIYATKGDEV